MSTYAAPPPREGTVRIGAGAGFAGDRLEPAELLAEHASLDALVFECLAERTIAAAQERIASGSGVGFDEHLLDRIRGTAPLLQRRKAPIVTNAGAADPVSAARAVRGLLDSQGLDRVRVAAVVGDDVLSQLDLSECPIPGGGTLADIRDRVISANAYIGVAPMVEALHEEAGVVITGRCADAALFLAPIAHRFGWSVGDLDRMARGTLVGHLLECGGQLTGGYFADGVSKVVPSLWSLGFPFADVDADGDATYSKLEGTGGRVDRQTVLEQLLYEIDDPRDYRTPDVSVDLSQVALMEIGPDLVSVSGARSSGRPSQLKVSIGIRDGFLATGQIAYAGAHARKRAELAAEIVRERWTQLHRFDAAQLEHYLVGVNAARPWWTPGEEYEPPEVLVRFSLRTNHRHEAEVFLREVESLYTNGPYGGGGAVASFKETIGITSAMIARELVTPEVAYL